MLRFLRLTALALLLAFLNTAPSRAAFDYAVGGTPPYSGTQLITDINEELTGIQGVITDAETACFAALTSAADKVPYFTGLGTCALADLTSAGRALIDDADASAQRTTLGLVIGTNVQAYDADLTTYAGITPSANVQSLLGAANYAAMRALLDLEAGTDFYSIAAADAAFQPLDADLTAIAGLTSAADKVPYFTGAGTAAVADFSSAIRTLITTPSSANLRSMLSDETGTGAAMFGLTTAMADDLSCTGSQVVRRNAGDTAFECATVSVSDTLGPDGDKGDITVGGTGTTLTIDAGAVSADELDETGVEAGLEAVIDLADLQGDLALGTKTSGNYVDDVTAGTGIAVTHTPGEGSDAAVALSYSDQGASPSLSADQCVFTSNATTSGFIVCEGDTADAFETRITVTDATADRLFTIPNADSVAVQPNTCSGTDKVTGVSSAGVVSCAADEGGAGSGDNIGVEDGDNAGTYTSASDANFEDSGDINFTLNTTPSPDEISATIRTGVVSADELDEAGVEAGLEAVIDLADLQGDLALGTKTSGNYAAGDAEAGAALTGDTATAFFSAGTIELARGGTGASLTDPNADRIMFWDDSAGATAYLTTASPITISTTTIDIDAATESAEGVCELATTTEAATGTDTTRCVTAAGVLAAVTGLETIWVPANAIVPNTTSGCAASNTETTTNDVMIPVCDFDAATDEAAQFTVGFPKNWDEGTITAQFSWTAASGTGNAIWGLQCLARSDDDALDTAFGTAQTVTDGLTATGDLMISGTTSAITVGGTVAEGDIVWCRAYRDADNGSDTFSADARLVGVRVFYTTNAYTDD